MGVRDVLGDLGTDCEVKTAVNSEWLCEVDRGEARGVDIKLGAIDMVAVDSAKVGGAVFGKREEPSAEAASHVHDAVRSYQFGDESGDDPSRLERARSLPRIEFRAVSTSGRYGSARRLRVQSDILAQGGVLTVSGASIRRDLARSKSAVPSKDRFRLPQVGAARRDARRRVSFHRRQLQQCGLR